MALCSESAGNMLTPYFSTSGRITGPPLIRVSLLARAMSLPSLIASIVGLRPAAPTMPVTTVSAVSTVEQARIPSSPNMISGIFLHPAPSRRSLSSLAAASVAREAIFGLYFMTCSAMSSALFPAERASTTKLSGQASTISNVCVPILPVDPNNDNLFWNSAPSSDLARVFFIEASVFTGAEGFFSHPSPVPFDPERGAENAAAPPTTLKAIKAAQVVFMMVVLDFASDYLFVLD
mmetsp:Transcript_28994/g.47873  ORF Transcript_28994/g.47873 Transcript_28994/m.47873 type:complete len:235 (+) Transcript_28994:417-1121(+)